jgi:hypothetical protein
MHGNGELFPLPDSGMMGSNGVIIDGHNGNNLVTLDLVSALRCEDIICKDGGVTRYVTRSS